MSDRQKRQQCLSNTEMVTYHRSVQNNSLKHLKTIKKVLNSRQAKREVNLFLICKLSESQFVHHCGATLQNLNKNRSETRICDKRTLRQTEREL